MKKRMFMLLLAALVLLTACGAQNSQPEMHISGDFIYTVQKDGTAAIRGFDSSNGTMDVEIPEMLDGHRVTAIEPGALYFFHARLLIPATVTRIEPYAFADMTGEILVAADNPAYEVTDGVLFDKRTHTLMLYSVPSGAAYPEIYAIPEGTQAIAPGAFLRTGANTVTIPNSLTKLEDNPFAGGLIGAVQVEDDHPSLAVKDGMLYDKTNGRLLFCGMMADGEVRIPEGMRTIVPRAFENCRITGVVLPDSLTTIGDRAFGDCDKLRTISLPAGVANVGDNPFDDCDALTNVVVHPDNRKLADIDGVLFDKQDKRLITYPKCRKQKTYAVPEGIRKIGAYAFSGAQVQEVILPDSLTDIGDSAFAGCNHMTQLSPGKGLKRIGPWAFTYVGLQSLTLPNGTTDIGDYAFMDARMTTLTIPASVKTIGMSALRGPETIIVRRNSFAARYCGQEGLNYRYDDAQDWLK